MNKTSSLAAKPWKGKLLFLYAIFFLALLLYCFFAKDTLFTQVVATPAVNASQAFKPLASNNTISQTFLCPKMELKTIELGIATFERNNKGNFKIALSRADGTVVEEKSVETASLERNETIVWDLQTPIVLQQEEKLCLEISTNNVEPGNEISFFYSFPATQTGSSFSFNGTAAEEGTLAFRALGTAVRGTGLFLSYFIVAFFCLLLILVFAWCVYCEKKTQSNIVISLITKPFSTISFTHRQQHFFYLFILTGLVFAIYWQYLLGLKYFVFRDAANDSFAQTYPNLLDTSRTFWQGAAFPHYNMLTGLGNAQGWSDPFNALLAMLGEATLAYLLGLFQAIKVLIAGILFYAFLRKAKFAYAASVLCGLGYAFCGPMMLHSSWNSYPNEIVCVAFVLLALELLFQENNYFLLPVSFALYGICTDILRLCVYTVIFIAYAGFRYILDTSSFKFRYFAARIAKVSLLLVGGVFLSMTVIIPAISTLFASERLHSSLSSGFSPIAFFSDGATVAKSFLRLFSNDLLGTGAESSAQSYLDDPAFYFGILNLIILPQIFVHASRKQRILYASALSLVGGYVGINYLRFAMNGFSRETFKLSALWIPVLLLFFAAHAWNRLFTEKIIHLPLLLTSAFTIGFLLFVFSANQTVRLQSGIAVYITLLLGILLLYQYYRRPSSTTQLLLVVLLSAELLFNGYSTQNYRGNISAPYANTLLHNHSTAQLVNELRQNSNDYFRISYPNSELCASLAQDYMSTTSYVGGTGLSTGYKKLLKEVAGEASGKISSIPYFTYGYDSMRSINTLFGVEYMVQKKDEGHSNYLPYGYTKVENEDFWVYKNEYSLPLAFTYDTVMSENAFKQLNKAERRDALLQSAVVPNNSPLLQEGTPLGVVSALNTPFWPAVENGALPVIVNSLQTEEGKPMVEINLQETSSLPYLILYADIKALELEYYDYNPVRIEWALENEEYDSRNCLEYKMSSGDDTIFLELPATGVDRIRISCNGNCNYIHVKKVSAVDDSFFDTYRQNVLARKKDDVQITYLENDHIECTATLGQEKLLCFTFSNAPGWVATVNGQKVPIYTLNDTFMGLMLPAGENTVRLQYRPSWLDIPAIISLSFWVLYFILLVIWLFHKKKRKTQEGTKAIEL